MAMQLLVGVPLEMVHGALRIGLVYVCGVLAGESNSAYIYRFTVCDEKVCFFNAVSFKCPCYALSDISFHVMFNITVCECKSSERNFKEQSPPQLELLSTRRNQQY